MSSFVERPPHAASFKHCGRMLVREEKVVIIIDAVCQCSLSVKEIHLILAGFGPLPILDGDIQGEARLSLSGRGFDMQVGSALYVTPVAHLRRLLEGAQKKAPISKRPEEIGEYATSGWGRRR
jgi:hypothetical protein